MSKPFSPSMFSDGSKPGSDPYDNPNRQYQTAAPWSSPHSKAAGANALADFIERGVHVPPPSNDPLAWALDHMGHLPGHHDWQRMRALSERGILVEALRRAHTDRWHGDGLTRPRLWCDVEEAFVRWLDESGVGDRILAERAAEVEAQERATLRALLAKYPDEVVPA